MSRLRRYLLPLLLLLPLALLCGKLLLTPVASRVFVGPSWPSISGNYKNVPERGWPWLYQRVDGIDWKFHFWPLLADVAVLLAVLGIAAVLLAIHHRRRGAWLRFSLREFLMLTAVIATALGWWMSQYHSYQREQATLRYLEFLDDQAIIDGNWQSSIASEYEDHSPQWLHRIWPGTPLYYFKRVNFLYIGDSFLEKLNIISHELPRRLETAIKTLPYVRGLHVEKMLPFERLDPVAFSNVEELGISLLGRKSSGTPGGPIRWQNLRSLYFCCSDSALSMDDDLECFSHCSRLEEIIVDGPVTDAGIRHLLKLQNLRRAYIYSAEITDAALKELSQIQSLERMTLMNCKRITDQGIGDFVHLKKDLNSISLYGLQVTDTGLEYLAQFRSLESVDVRFCPNITEHGIRLLLQISNLTRISPRTLVDFPEALKQEFLQRGISVE